MKKHRPILFASCLLCTLTLSAQQTPPPQNPTTVIRIDVNLVQVDAVVTDKRGRPVTDLTAEDFEVFQDGMRQKINSVEFVKVKDPSPLDPRSLQVVTRPKNGDVPAPPRTAELRADQIRRTIALVVDDLGLSFESILHIRESLKKWVDTEMQKGDLVAIVRTSAGMGSLQRFTMDREMLHSAIDLIQPHNGRVGTASFKPVAGAMPTDGVLDTSLFDDEVEHAYLAGSLGAIQYVVRGLRDLPGRKSLVLFSESMRFTYLEGPGIVASSQVTSVTGEERLRKLTDEANRSSVVIYAVDPRGALFDGLTSEDSTGGLEDSAVRQAGNDRTTQLIESRDGMYALTQRTGGLFVHDSNDLGGLLRQVVDDGDGYYLIGYTPELSTFDQGTGKAIFHKISVRVSRPGLSVRSRTGFFGRPDNPSIPPDEAARAQLAHALISPFVTGDVGVRLTGLFFPAPAAAGSIAGSIQIMLHIDPSNLTFTEEADGTKTAEVEIASVTFDADGQQVDALGEGSKIRIPKEAFEAVQRVGVVYTGQLPVKKPGGYQLRVVVRDKTTKKLGSAMQFIDVPDLKNGRLALSGIVMAEQPSTAPVDNAVASAEKARTAATPANRVFKSGAEVVFAYEVLNAKIDADKKPQLDATVRVFRDGKEIYGGKPETLSSAVAPSNPKRIPFSGGVRLSSLAPGHYTLQLIVADNNRYDKYHLAAQAIDFEVRP